VTLGNFIQHEKVRIMKFRFVRGRYEGRTVDLHAGMKIGRAEDNDLVIDEDGVSRHHCRVNGSGEDLKIEDLESTNGTRVNGERLTELRDVTAGDRIGIGGAVLLVTDDAGNIPATAATGDMGKSHLLAGTVLGVLVSLLVFGGIAVGVYFGTDWARRPMVQRDRDPSPEPVNGMERVETMDVDAEDVGPDADGGDAEAEQLEFPDNDLSFVEDQELADAAAAVEPEEALRGEEPGNAQGEPSFSNAVVVKSAPSGATVSLDGEVIGETPLVFQPLSEGRHRIELSLEGYDTVSRLVHAPLKEELPVLQMHLSPGVLRVTSTPSGAAVVHGGQVLGNTPLITNQLPEGRTEIRLLNYGYEPLSIRVEVDSLRGESVHGDMVPAMGTLRVVTIPAGCDVSLNGLFKGRTSKQSEKGENRSDPFIITRVRAGTHVVEVTHPNLAEPYRKQVTVASGEEVLVPVRMFVLAERVVLTNGTEHVGMTLAVNELDDIMFVTPQKKMTFLKETVASIEPLPAEEAEKILAAAAAEKAEAEAANRPNDEEGGGFWENDEVPVDEKGWGEEEETALEPEVLELSESEVRALLEGETATNLVRIFAGKLVRVTGTPTSSRSNLLEGHVQFGREIRCVMPRGEYDRVKDQLKRAESGGSVTITGVGKTIGNILVLEKCTVD
jgi:hypothetical protein